MQIHDLKGALVASVLFVAVAGAAIAQPVPGNGGVAQGSSTPGQTGTLTMGTVDSNPSSETFYPTNATTQPLVLDNDGNLRVEQPDWSGSTTISTAGVTATFNTNTISGLTAAEFTAGSLVVFTGGSVPTGIATAHPYVIVTASSTVATIAEVATPTTPLTFAGGAVTSTGTQGDLVPVSDSMGAMGLTGVFSGGGTLSFLSSPDGLVWIARNYLSPASGTLALTMTSTTDGKFNIGGSLYLVPYISTAAGGQTVKVTYNQSAASTLNALTSPLPNGGNTIGTVNQGTPNGGGASAWPVSGSFTYTSNYLHVSDIPTVQNAAYAAGQSLGGLQTLTVSTSGLFQQVQLLSKGGSVVGVWVYAWSKNPTSTTCTDKANFVVNASDNTNLIAQPFLVSLALGVSAQDTTTYGQVLNIAAPFTANSGSSMYVCLLASAAVTPATTTDYQLIVSAVQ